MNLQNAQSQEQEREEIKASQSREVVTADAAAPLSSGLDAATTEVGSSHEDEDRHVCSSSARTTVHVHYSYVFVFD